MQLKKLIYVTLLIFSVMVPIFATAQHQIPFFNETSEKEYRDAIAHLMEMLPEAESKAVYTPLIRPFSLLDVHPTKFTSNKNKAEFSNFNLGVMGGKLGIKPKDVGLLPELILCNDELCIDNRIETINAFLNDAETGLNAFAQSADIFLVSQLSAKLFRVNHVFVSNGKAYEYNASENAGFIPSANFTEYKTIGAAPQLQHKVDTTAALRKIMKKYGVAAVIRSGAKTLNIIFNGAGDNQWGVVVGEAGMPVPKSGDISHLGYAIDKVKIIDTNAFYYQTQ